MSVLSGRLGSRRVAERACRAAVICRCGPTRVLALVDTHITTACVTLYLHRCQTHRSHHVPSVGRASDALLALGADGDADARVGRRAPLSSRERGRPERIRTARSFTASGGWCSWAPASITRRRTTRTIVEQYGKGTPDDVLERRLYEPLSLLGPVVTLFTNLWLFGMWGLAMWLVEMAWIPFFAAGVINGLGHWWGYRNFSTPDESRNLPGRYWSILTCGEALHNNHHHIQNSARFAMRPGRAGSGLLVLLCVARARPGARASGLRGARLVGHPASGRIAAIRV